MQKNALIKVFWVVFLLASPVLLSAYGSADTKPKPGQWLDNAGEEKDFAAVIQQLLRADVVLLGEAHDSKDSHQEQARVIAALSEQLDQQHSAVALGMEQLDLDYVNDLRQHNRPGQVRTARSIAKAGGFDEQGWGWSQYEPIFHQAAKHSLAVFPLNLSRDDARVIATSADDEWRLALTDEQLAVVDQLAPDLRLPNAAQQALQDVLAQAHCHEVSDNHTARVARAQIVRDILMAKAIVDARKQHEGHQIVAIMGNQHALKTRGVPYWLAQMQPQLDVAVVGMLPVNTPGGDQMQQQPPLGFDWRYFAEPVERPDFCATDDSN